MNVLTIGDPHFTSANSVKVLMLIEKIVDLISKNRFDFVVILGDVLHTHEKVHTIAMNHALDFFKKVSAICATYVLVGNHDLINNSQFLSKNHWMNSIKKWDNITIVDSTINVVINSIQFTMVPFVPPGRLVEALDTCIGWRQSRTIFAHQEFKGCKMKTIVSTDGDEWDEKYPYVVSGHIHGNHMVGKNIYYPGTPHQTRFGESKKKTVSILTYSPDQIYPYIKKVSLYLPTKEIINVDSKNLNTWVLPESKDVEYKVEITGSIEEFKTYTKSKNYVELSKKCIIVFKTNSKNNDKLVPSFVNKNDSFSDVLRELIKNEQDIVLTDVYDTIVGNTPDIIFLDSDEDL